MISDREFLDQFLKQGSEDAFSAIVERYVNAVFSAALRRLGGDSSLAQDATQEVFSALARQASSIRAANGLGGWLHRHTCFITANIVRSEQRRKTRELKTGNCIRRGLHPICNPFARCCCWRLRSVSDRTICS
jgi:DNA-directed RNA polymerase specialized sigma24 family protein